MDGLQSINSLLKLEVVGGELCLATHEHESMEQCWGSNFGISLSQLLFDILLSPRSKRGESRTRQRQRILLSWVEQWVRIEADVIFLPKAWNLSILR